MTERVQGGKMLTPEMYKEALKIGSCGSVAQVVLTFERHMRAMCEDGKMNTDTRNSHPISVLHATYLKRLTMCEDWAVFSRAYDECDRLKDGIVCRYYGEAILIQDACNLSGVLFSFAKYVEEFKTTLQDQYINSHPVCVLFASKIASLAGCQSDTDGMDYTCARILCENGSRYGG